MVFYVEIVVSDGDEVVHIVAHTYNTVVRIQSMSLIKAAEFESRCYKCES